MIDGRNLSLNSYIKKFNLVLICIFTLFTLTSCNVKFITTKTENESFNQYLYENGIELEKETMDTSENAESSIEETNDEVLETSEEVEVEVIEEDDSTDRIVKEKENANVDRLLFVGDNYPGKHGQNAYDSNGVSGVLDWYFKKQISNADILIGNLETSLSDSVNEKAYEKTYSFTTHSKYKRLFRDISFDAMSLANNHILDYGRECLTDTIKNLKSVGITPIGAGENEEEANVPFVKEINGRKYAIFAATSVAPYDDWFATSDKSGVSNGYNQIGLRASINKYKKDVDKIIVFMHWGKELELVSNDTQKRIAKSLIDMGVDAVIGCHQHIPQEVEYYKGKPIVYGLGNFVFGVTDREMFMAELRFTYEKDASGKQNETMQLIMHPGTSGYQRVVYNNDPNNRMQQLVDLLVRSSATCNITAEGLVTPK